MTESEIEALGTCGWFSRSGFDSAPQTARVAQARSEQFVAARIARAHRQDDAVRNDRRLWVPPDDPELAPLLAGFEALRVELNEGAWLGLVRFEVQLAHFPGAGERYVRHRDAWPGSDNRRLTAISYLNAGWTEADGGQLRLHLDPPVEIEPRLGRLVVFLSDRIEHEVLPVWAPRFAATAWFYGS